MFLGSMLRIVLTLGDWRREKTVPAPVNQVSVLVGDHDVYKDWETYLEEKLVKMFLEPCQIMIIIAAISI